MNSSYSKEIFRSIKKGWKRFMSILIITALGVAMLTGLYAACLDMYYSGDRFFDEQNLFDIRVLSTLGLTGDDVEVLAQSEGVETAEGGYSETVSINVDGISKSAVMTVLSKKGLNTPYILAGTMPEKKGEIAVTQKYLNESGRSIGDTLFIEEDIENDIEENNNTLEEEKETPAFANTSYVITGVVMDPKDIASDYSQNGFRSAVAADYTFFITEADANSSVFTEVYLTLAETKGMNSYSQEYEDAIQRVINGLENNIKEDREQTRYDFVIMEARTKLEDAKITLNEKFEEAEEEFADAWKEIEEAGQKLADGEVELIFEEKNAKEKISDARLELETQIQKLEEGEEQLLTGEIQLVEGEKELSQNAQKLKDGKDQLEKEQQQAEEQFEAIEQQLLESQSQLDQAKDGLESGISQMKAVLGSLWPEKEWAALVNTAAALELRGADDNAIAEGTIQEREALASILSIYGDTLAGEGIQAALGMGKLQGNQQVLNVQKSNFEVQKDEALQKMAEAKTELEAGEVQIEAANQTIQSGREELEARKKELEEGKDMLAQGQETLNKEEKAAQKEIVDAWEEITNGEEELAVNEAKLIEEEKKYREKKEDALKELEDGYAEIEEIDMTKWYIQDRSSLDSYSSLQSDLSSIEAVGKIFPILFLLVAVLVSLTTMTRMVEEERGLIGTYTALGFSNRAVYGKYILFAVMACLLGGVLGDLFGFIFMSKFLGIVLETLYSLPVYYLRFDVLYGVGGVILFMAGVVGATALACRSELRQLPSALMRPKAPKPGVRVILEYIPGVWNRLKFLNKVTIRNLFRYRKRLIMTVGGIMGCTALILCGFAIKDSIADLGPKQYDGIYQYDLMAVAEEENYRDFEEELMSQSNITDYLPLRIESIKLMNPDGEGEKVQLMVIPDGAAIEEYIHIENRDGTLVHLDDKGILVTQNAAQILDLESGDRVALQNMELVQKEGVISYIVENYLGNNVYMSQNLYESLFHEYKPNGVLAHLSVPGEDHAAYAETLREHDFVLSAVSTRGLKEEFGFDLINAVVLLIIVMAGGLALVVLFTLSNTNISERVRELATIKVLGFYDKEVYQYVNKETLILTTVGILIGLPVGRGVSGLLTLVLKMPSIYFAVYIEPVSYLISAVITFCFAIVVNFMTNRTLNRINMIEALKSVE